MRKIWVVMGSSGEYSDARQWLVCAYADEVQANRHADAAMMRAKKFETAECEHGEGMREWCSDCKREAWGTDSIRAWMGDLDPVAERMDYTGTDYVALPVAWRASRGERP